MPPVRALLKAATIAYALLKNGLCVFTNSRSGRSICPAHDTRRGTSRRPARHLKSVHLYSYAYAYAYPCGFTKKAFLPRHPKGNGGPSEEEPLRTYLLNGQRRYFEKKRHAKKRHEKRLHAESMFFNPKQFKNLFPEEGKKKGAGAYDDDCLNLEEVENLQEISPDLYKKLSDYNKEEALDQSKGESDQAEETFDGVDPKDISVYEGLPLLMIDGKDFQGFPDNRKVKISPEIATPFDNSEYDDFVESNRRKSDVCSGSGGNVRKGSQGEAAHKSATHLRNGVDAGEDVPDFERDVLSIIGEGEQSPPKSCDVGEQNPPKSCDAGEKKMTKEEKIERYKKVGRHYHMDSQLGEILYDRDYPGYIYLNHGEDIKELDEKSEFDSESPGYINPSNVFLRTGRKREEQKKKDSGIKQKRRWNLKVEKDIKRGNWKYYDDTVKDLLDSTDQEKLEENYYSNNYYQRSNNNTGFGSTDKVQNNYFDVQFIGSAETYPANVSVGMNFIWPINFIPMLCKQYPKRLGQPIKSDIFNLGGFDSLQLWFYPDGMNNSIDGFCALKLMMRPGSYLPVKIFLFAFSEYNYLHTQPFYKESADYVAVSLNLCKCLLKTKENLKKIENNKDYVILGPAGNIYIGVGIFDDTYDLEEDFKKFYSVSNKYKNKKPQCGKENHQFKYDWDEGVHIFDNWLKKQTAVTEDKDELLPVYYTHSELYENYKYRYVPEKNPFKFLNRKPDRTKWNRHPF
ncbi:conserved Plasmodium protein, unknown function [Plasmodium vivax]|nr:unnamed protein product [Plasmodium vivax]CAI7723556.1 conserved protein, unknown function [Plasmodium vivax]SCO69974.1 conserved Plasmodium protein, unknown function [Plasmodium vivax]SCO75465.1 conserved Plasmodium protein, unknown function [Plasmodium vivax]